MVSFVFVTGGVLSSVGKGVTTASLASLVESCGLKVSVMKLDPYLNVDPGTMNPFQHGEVYVTTDGAETDLDLGHYERFTHSKMTAKNSYTAGKIYSRVIERERRGEYNGQTIQVIPHVTNAIKECIYEAASGVEVMFVEVGGTVGDIESLPFLEAIRQMRLELGKTRTLFVHVAYVPYLASSGEIKTKPTQRSVRDMQSTGLAPDLIFCRSENKIPEEALEKVGLFSSLSPSQVISLEDVESIYEIPLLLKTRGADKLLLSHFGLSVKSSELSDWRAFNQMRKAAAIRKNVYMVGKYALKDAYFSLSEAVVHAGIELGIKVNLKWIESQTLESMGPSELEAVFEDADAILSPGGFGHRGIEGKIIAARFARTRKIPYLGICLGMQVAVIEMARNIVGLKGANSTEFQSDTPHPIFAKIDEWMDAENRKRAMNHSYLGGTMRLGEQPFVLEKGSLWASVYGALEGAERHRHRYEFNDRYEQALKEAGLRLTGRARDGLLECVELPREAHPFFLGCQSHPEFKSTPREPHPLFLRYLQSTLT